MPFKKSHTDMFTYYGNKKNGTINWNLSKNEPVMVYLENSSTDNEVEIEESVQTDEYGEVMDGEYYQESEVEKAVNFYEMTAGKLGWINCDRFYDVKNTSPLIVRVNSADEMVVRLVFRNINSVMPAYANSNHKDQYEATGIPTGEKVLLLAYSVKDENAILGYKEITIGENRIENIALNTLTKTRFKSAVSELLSY